jgi:polyketide cyclase/dehydrase/lipid transport protein
MALSICPASTVSAPVQIVWDVLTRPESFGQWADARVESVVPPGPLAAGQMILLTAPALGRNWEVRFDVARVDPERHEIELHVKLPLDMHMEEHLSCTPVDEQSCQVQYG